MSAKSPVLDSDLVVFNSATSFPGLVLIGVFVKNISAEQQNVTLQAKKMCTLPDIDNFLLKIGYMTPAFPVPGAGTITIKQLSPDQIANNNLVNGKKIILIGSQFTANFKVETPATLITPTGVVKDPISQYPGMGTFQNILPNFTEI